MKYSFKELTIKELVDLIDGESLDLNPDYQRNFIWSKDDQSDLVDTILKEYPLPNFFMYDGTDRREMVDGQQRSKSIYRFIKGIITSSKNSGKLSFQDVDKEKVLNYKLPFVVIDSLESNDSLRSFYVLINKKGKHLNNPEVHKSEFYDTNFMKLANDVLGYQNFIDLNIFTPASAKRMNDRDFVQELLVYLKLGIVDKKSDVQKTFENDIDDKEREELKNSFEATIDIIKSFNDIEPIKKTRYKQKNDFYTLFSFVSENLSENIETLKYQYRVLLVLNEKDSDGKQFIRPTNEECESLREYARNCVTQSNSKTARKNRLSFFNEILKNKDYNKNETLVDVLKYLGQTYGSEKIELIKVGDFELLNVELLK